MSKVPLKRFSHYYKYKTSFLISLNGIYYLGRSAGSSSDNKRTMRKIYMEISWFIKGKMPTSIKNNIPTNRRSFISMCHLNYTLAGINHLNIHRCMYKIYLYNVCFNALLAVCTRLFISLPEKQTDSSWERTTGGALNTLLQIKGQLTYGE